MRLRSIWSIPAMGFKERLRRTRDWAALRIAVALPKRIRYWSTVNDLGWATRDSENVPDEILSNILKNLRAPKNLA